MWSRASLLVLALCASCHHDDRCLAPMTEIGDPAPAARAGEAEYRLKAWHENVQDVRNALGCADTTTSCCDVVLRRVHEQRGDLALDIASTAHELVGGSAPATQPAARAVETSLRHLADLMISGTPAGGDEDVAKTCHDVTGALDRLYDSGHEALEDEVARAGIEVFRAREFSIRQTCR